METIVALASGQIKSALSIIRLSGDDVFDIVQKIFTKRFDLKKKKELLFGYIVDKEKTIDQVVLLKYLSPHSFTGENAIEIICHGSMLIAREIIDLCLKHGARLAHNGEFSSRAYLNNKIDLIQAEAINDLINALSKESQEIALSALKGEVSKEFYPLKTALADLLSNIEVNIDFPEYQDIEEVNREKIIAVVTKIKADLRPFLLNAKEAIKIKDGVNVALVGKPNVGKSSLLNALINEDKAIVTDIEGTTRDIVEGTFVLNGIPIHLFDTAGLRETNNLVEKIGIDKTNETIKKADLILYIVDEEVDQKITSSFYNIPYIIVHNKADIFHSSRDAVKTIASKKEISSLLEAMKAKLNIQEEIEIKPSFNNARQLGLLEKLDKALSDTLIDVENNLSIDLVAISLMEGYNAAVELLGEGNKNDLSEEIFSRFCVGK